MSLLLAMIIGVIIGAGASFLFGPDPEKMFINCLLGLSGGILGLVFFFLTVPTDTDSLFSPVALLASAVLAALLVTLFNLLHKAAPKSVGKQNPPVYPKKH